MPRHPQVRIIATGSPGAQALAKDAALLAAALSLNHMASSLSIGSHKFGPSRYRPGHGQLSSYYLEGSQISCQVRGSQQFTTPIASEDPPCALLSTRPSPFGR